MSTAPRTEYLHRKSPFAVQRWEETIRDAETQDDAQTQMLYVTAVETRKLRLTVQYGLAALAVLVVLGIILVTRSLSQLQPY